MKKIYFFVFSLLLLTGYTAQSQCTNASAFGSAVAPTTATPVTISTCSFQQEYSTITSVVAGNVYVVTGSIAGTFITMRYNTPSGTVVAAGVTPLQFRAPCSGTYYAHWNTNSSCGTAATCMTTTIACSSCGAGSNQCNNASAFGTITAPTVINVPTTISTCSFQQEYSTINSCVANRVYKIDASIAGTFITIRQGTSGGSVIASGIAPLVFTATVGGTYYAHWNTNTGCGTAATCMTTTATYIADLICVGPPANDLCTGALPISCAGTVTGNTSAATVDAVPTCVTTLNTAPGVWYTFVGTGQIVTLSLCGSSYDTKIGVFTGTCASLVCVTGNDDFCGLQSQVNFPSVLGTTYYVLVTGFGSGAGAFTLAMTCTSAIPNDNCTGAITIGCGQTITGTTVGATVDAVPTCVTTLNTAPGIWYTFVGNGATNTLTMCGSSYDTKIGVFTGTCASLVCVTGNDDFCGLQSQVTFATTAGTTYYVIVTGFGSAAGAFTLTRTSAALPNDVCSGAININCGQTITGSTACGATPDAVATCVTTLNTAAGVWYQFVGDGSPVTMSLCGSSYDTKIGIFTGTCTSLTCVTGNDDFCGLQSQVTFNTNAGFTYYVLVTGFGTATGNFTLTRSCAPPCSGVPSPGAIAPVTTTTCVGNSVTLTCSGYSANSALTFQWSSAPAAAGPYTNIGGATSNVYTFNAPATTTYYRCTVTCSNGGGNATTAPVVVNVSNIQFTATAATPSTVCSPGSVTITGTVTGGLNLGNYTFTLTGAGTIGAPVYSGPNNSSVSFSVTNIPAGLQAYTLTATDPVPCSKSTTINVTVNLTPVVTLAPASVTICNGAIQPVTGTVTTGTGTFVFSPTTELYTDAGATIPYTGTALASGTIIYAKPTVTRTYTATVTSPEGCSSSTPITITVNQLPAITSQPVNLAAPVCPGFNVVYSLTATGTGISYQWQVSTDGGTTWNNTLDGAQYTGSFTNSLTIYNVTTGMTNYKYRCVVTGVCPPPAISNVLTLVVATPPTISTQPASATICSLPASPTVLLNNTTVVFSVVATGIPAPTIYKWQVSTDGGATWNDLANSASASASPFYGGVFTPALTVTNAPVSLNGYRYRVIITNNCNQSVTSNGSATLTVNASPAVVATDLFNQRICVSDTLVSLVGTPAGGAWTGIGVSGFNFVPGATAVGGPFILTYTYTNSLGCTVSDTTSVKVLDCPERIRELSRDGAVTIYPNPNNGRFNIRLNSTLYNYLGMKVYNQLGELMNGKLVKDLITKRYTMITPTYTGLYYGRVIPIDLSNLPGGTYLVELYYDDGVRTSKKGFLVVIQKQQSLFDNNQHPAHNLGGMLFLWPIHILTL